MYDQEPDGGLEWELEALSQINSAFEPDPIMPCEDELVILNFLKRFNVRHADEAGPETVNILWASLGRNPSLVKDFAYLLTDINSGYYYSNYPLPISIEDMIEMCGELKGADESQTRMKLVDEVVIPNISRLGYGEEYIRKGALGEFYNLPRRGEAVRFLGWLAGQGFMTGQVDNQLGEFFERNEIEQPRFTHLALIAGRIVRKELKYLKGRSGVYRRPISMAERALPVYEDMVYAMQGINNVWDDLFLRSES